MYNNSPYIYYDDLSHGAQPTANFQHSYQSSFVPTDTFDHFSTSSADYSSNFPHLYDAVLPPVYDTASNGIYTQDDTPHSHDVHTDAPLHHWPSTGTQSAPSVASRPTGPMPATRLTVPRAHPYKKPSGSYTSRSLSRSPSSELSPLLSPSYSPSYSTSAPSASTLLTPTYSHTMAHHNQHITPTIMINSAPATHIPIPRRIPLPQSAALKPGYRPNYRVSFKINGVPGFRVGDALRNPNFNIDNGDEIVLATCSDRKVHAIIDIPNTASPTNGFYLSTVWTPDPKSGIYYPYTRKNFAKEVAMTVLRARFGKHAARVLSKPMRSDGTYATKDIDDLWVSSVSSGPQGRWVLDIDEVQYL